MHTTQTLALTRYLPGQLGTKILLTIIIPVWTRSRIPVENHNET